MTDRESLFLSHSVGDGFSLSRAVSALAWNRWTVGRMVR